MARRVSWGTAKIEVLALADEIRTLVDRGIPTRQIFNQLKNDGRIAVGQRSFYRWVKTLRSKQGVIATHKAGPTQANPKKPPAPPRPTSSISSADLPGLSFNDGEDDPWLGINAAPLDPDGSGK